MPGTSIPCAGQWLRENKEALQSNNKALFDGQQLQMVFFGGPESGENFIFQETEQVFYQPDGGAILNVKQNDSVREIHLNQNDVLIVPENVEHSFKREKNTIGSVIRKTQTNGSNRSSPDQLAKVSAPINVKQFIEEHISEINKAPYLFFGPPQTKSVLKLYGQGTHHLSSCASNELIIIVQKGEAKYSCDETGENASFQSFHIAHFQTNSQITLEVSEGGVCFAVQVPA